MADEGLAPALLERVLERLGFGERPAPDAGGLAALYGAWCRRNPFGNVRKRLHVAAKGGHAARRRPDIVLRRVARV